MLRERLEERCALVKGETAQIGAADLARVGETCGDVESVGGGVGDHLARGRIA
jgi:hypothetical protein